MARNSLFAVLLRSPWWVSAGLALMLGALAWVLLPVAYRAVGVMGAFPFVAIAAVAAWRQRHAPSEARVAETAQAVRALAWESFAALLEQAFQRDGHAVTRRAGAGADFNLDRKGRRMVVAARRWKSDRTGLEPLRALQAAREAAEAPDALYIGLGDPSDPARAYLAEHGIAYWQAPELAQALRGLALPAPAANKSRAGR